MYSDTQLPRLHYTMKGTTSVLQCVHSFSSHWFQCVPILLCVLLVVSQLLQYIAHMSSHVVLLEPQCVPLAHFETNLPLTHCMSYSTLWLSHVLSLSVTFLFNGTKYNFSTTSSYFLSCPQIIAIDLGFWVANILLV
jgi:hypothetical protein